MASARSIIFGNFAKTKGLSSWLIGAILFLLALAAYFPALHGGILWDDPAHLTAPALQSLAGLRRIWFEPGTEQQYYPFLQSAFWLEHRLWGDAVVGYHLINVILHVASGILFARLLQVIRIGEAKESDWLGSWFAAAIFILHPVCVESVAWISEQKNTLSTFFYLLSALYYLRFSRDRRWQSYLIAFVCFIIALLSKSVTATLPAALLLIEWYRTGRLAWKRDVIPLLPWFMVGAAMGLLTAWVERHYIGAQGAAYELSFWARTLLAGRVVWFYLGKIFWPSPLIFIYPHWDVRTDAVWCLGLVALVAVIFFFWKIRHWNRAPLTAFLYFIGTLFPVLGFLNVYPFVFSYVADHWQYLACLGPIAWVAESAVNFVAQSPQKWLRIFFLTLSSGLVAALFGLTRSQAGNYRDGDHLYKVTLRQNPQCWMAYNNLGLSLLDSGAVPAAIDDFKAALRLRPDYSDAHNNLGNAFARAPGKMIDAILEYSAAARLSPRDGEIRFNLGSALASVGRLPEALPELQLAAQLSPWRAEIHLSLGLTLAELQRNEEARQQFIVAVQLDPKSAAAHLNVARFLKNPDETAAALAHYREALRLAPGSAEIWNSYGTFALRNDRSEEALHAFAEAVRLDPQSASYHNNLGIALRQAGQLDEAIRQFQLSLQLNPSFNDAHYNLGLTLQKAGRIEEADTEFKRSGHF